ncbi:Putative SKP1/BTB/POZ domain superfamily protein [Colletotrichum destructivum]|uniref:SKP1/BTB/POZ domain superfamily protein n=1 Tax=Colletotrichum destructivum TaxID=34406 RepID=A0AAX4IRC8_9PEZI|nr:Putative SKP1/BTB/POZ domain superfamily protein [Colletotrichum destructivum]
METFATFMEYVYTQDFTIDDADEKPDYPEISLMGLISRRISHVVMDYADDHFDTKHDTRETIQHSPEYYMSIARLYNFANQYDLSELMDLCTEKVRLSLANTSFDDTDALSIWTLLEFIWPTTNVEDKLREVLLRFVLLNLATAMQSGHSFHVLKNIPEISTALLFMTPSSYWEELSSYN